MRRIAVATLVSLLLASATSVVQAAPIVKPGAKCVKVSATATVAGKKFTCTKSGSKLIWKQMNNVSTAPTFGELKDGPCTKSQLTLVSRHVTGQLNAIAKRDWKAAYSYAAASFQASISEAEFAMIIESSYELLITKKSFAFQECEILQGQILQGVLIQDDVQEVFYGYQLSYIDNRLGIVAASALAQGQATSV